MDALVLARIQFAVTIGFHFLFPPLSIGLAWLLVAMELRGLTTRDPLWIRMGQFFGKLFGLTFAVGVATGIVMEFQFGTNWANYSRFVGDIFGAPLAAEGVFAFFLESGFLGLYLFGRGRVSKGIHFFSILMVAVGATLSAFWILVANSWQQTPAGFELVDGRAQLTSFAEAVFNPSAWPRFSHTMVASLITGGFFVMGTAAWLVLKERGGQIARRALVLGAAASLVFSLLALFPTGHLHAAQVARTQPEKFAAIEGLYENYEGAPLVLFAFPSTPPPKLHATIEIPNLLSWLAFGDPDAPVKGLQDFSKDSVPKGAELWISFVSFHNMVALGMLFIATSALAVFLLWRKKLFTARWFLKAVVVVAPLTLAASQFGWVAAEVGRQPWIVYRLLRTSQAASPSVSAGELLFSLILFGAIYLALGALWVFLLYRKISHGPEPDDAKA